MHKTPVKQNLHQTSDICIVCRKTVPQKRIYRIDGSTLKRKALQDLMLKYGGVNVNSGLMCQSCNEKLQTLHKKCIEFYELCQNNIMKAQPKRMASSPAGSPITKSLQSFPKKKSKTSVKLLEAETTNETTVNTVTTRITTEHDSMDFEITESWKVITSPFKNTAVDAVETGCSKCEEQQCDGTVGWGGSPDEQGETTLDAMIMDGVTHGIGAVGALRRVKSAISVARAVMERTTHTMLAGDQATQFAIEMGFKEEDLHSNQSIKMYQDWKKNNCQPNYRRNVRPDPTKSCGPYEPIKLDFSNSKADLKDMKVEVRTDEDIYKNHDTIGMIVIDKNGNVAGGTSTNGMNHKVPGRVGDSPIPGSGAYVDNEVGGAAATGDGDIMMRFLPSFYAVTLMRTGASPSVAATEALKPIRKYYPHFIGALVASNVRGEHGAACYGIPEFPYSIKSPEYQNVTILKVPCIS